MRITTLARMSASSRGPQAIWVHAPRVSLKRLRRSWKGSGGSTVGYRSSVRGTYLGYLLWQPAGGEALAEMSDLTLMAMSGVAAVSRPCRMKLSLSSVGFIKVTQKTQFDWHEAVLFALEPGIAQAQGKRFRH